MGGLMSESEGEGMDLWIAGVLARCEPGTARGPGLVETDGEGLVDCWMGGLAIEVLSWVDCGPRFGRVRCEPGRARGPWGGLLGGCFVGRRRFDLRLCFMVLRRSGEINELGWQDSCHRS